MAKRYPCDQCIERKVPQWSGDQWYPGEYNCSSCGGTGWVSHDSRMGISIFAPILIIGALILGGLFLARGQGWISLDAPTPESQEYAAWSTVVSCDGDKLKARTYFYYDRDPVEVELQLSVPGGSVYMEYEGERDGRLTAFEQKRTTASADVEDFDYGQWDIDEFSAKVKQGKPRTFAIAGVGNDCAIKLRKGGKG